MTRLPIAVSGWGRTVAVARAAIPLFFMVFFAIWAFAPEIFEEDLKILSDSESAVVLVTGLGFAALLAWLSYLLIRPALVKRAYLELRPDALVVVHPGLLRKPFEIPRTSIRAAGIDPRQWRWRWLGNKGRFHLPGPVDSAGAPLPEWLFSVVGGSPFPLLSTVDDVPNVAFVFSEPIRIRAVRRGTRPFATKGPVHVPVHGRDIRGLLVKVKDVAATEQALSAWTTLRPLTTADVFEFDPDPAYARKAKRRQRATNVWFAILLLTFVVGPVLTELAEGSTLSP